MNTDSIVVSVGHHENVTINDDDELADSRRSQSGKVWLWSRIPGGDVSEHRIVISIHEFC
jgi:hypothetical protein